MLYTQARHSFDSMNSAAESWRHKSWNIPLWGEYRIPVGTTWSNIWLFEDASGQPVDMTTGYSAQMILKKRPSAPATVLSLASPAGGLTLDALGQVTGTLSAAQTVTLGVGRFSYELFVTGPGSQVTRLDYGHIEICP